MTMKFSKLHYLIENEQMDFDFLEKMPMTFSVKDRDVSEFLDNLIEENNLEDLYYEIEKYIRDEFSELNEEAKIKYINYAIGLLLEKIEDDFEDFEYNDNVVLYRNAEKLYFYDKEKQEFTSISEDDIENDPESFLYNWFPKYELKDLYIAGSECFYRDILKLDGGTYYHYTTEESLEEIQEDGYLRPSRGTGIENRSNFGIFTTVSPETYADGTYGDICLEIDLTSYIKDGNEVAGDVERPILETAIKEFIYCVLSKECESYTSSDYSYDTVILNPINDVGIPIKYIKIL